ncbi:hypothetical protein RV11_GL000630 [Enterococcus phoeniculicola]|jgi:ubiquinone/menaquinone biosynthesis C-methylase UbiE|uniref:Methyltransferase domain-containing protein n=1 Tax=Enterococcus phoeniculicola ATCC BAA-412 TaxID=1158610 RepID=R3TNP9_9ENTE|nr:class I SAM-dependent methyltransferase [Enterococcus phoeniculicola]EOL43154.1 hypothetical protein UC3_02131 [Enterococcus phoeniculicola ATCC BAA-412]EOT76488.1 hypothetical protein I589_01445 [Enterococcus phoeniculicola ATCC BAA-412]OJG71105.1 hypothetical protein RV11_GL000630 [Enterococcus phoeniculicola]
MKEIEDFWDEFAEEYNEIQEESELTLSSDVTNYFEKRNVFPANALLDLAGGSGRYLLDFSSNVKNYTLVDISEKMLEKAEQLAESHQRKNCQFLHKEMSDFFNETNDNAYEYVFSAMNPAIQSVANLLELNRISEKGVFIFRMTEETDSLFSVIDARLGIDHQQEELSWLFTYQEWLAELKFVTETKSFYYQYEEAFSRAFLETYYEEFIEETQFRTLLSELFSDNSTVTSKTTICFTLLYWKKKDTVSQL